MIMLVTDMFSFNSRSREGSDLGGDASPALPSVSTRAPAKGATFPTPQIRGLDDVSTRAPAKGATTIIQGKNYMTTVSTRAPAKGATNDHHQARKGDLFQLALPRRERPFKPLC